jgi:hypothetical protein
MVDESPSNRLEIVGELILNLDFWDCECKVKYIHHNSEKYCSKCKSFQDNQPNSRENEISRHYQPYN